MEPFRVSKRENRKRAVITRGTPTMMQRVLRPRRRAGGRGGAVAHRHLALACPTALKPRHKPTRNSREQRSRLSFVRSVVSKSNVDTKPTPPPPRYKRGNPREGSGRLKVNSLTRRHEACKDLGSASSFWFKYTALGWNTILV